MRLRWNPDSLCARDQLHQVGEFAEPEDEVVAIPKDFHHRRRNGREVQRAADHLGLERCDARRVRDDVSHQVDFLDDESWELEGYYYVGTLNLSE